MLVASLFRRAAKWPFPAVDLNVAEGWILLKNLVRWRLWANNARNQTTALGIGSDRVCLRSRTKWPDWSGGRAEMQSSPASRTAYAQAESPARRTLWRPP